MPEFVPAPISIGSGFIADEPRRARHRKRLAGIASATLLSLALTGCVSAAEMAARHRQACLTYGFAPATEGYANCLLQLDVGDYGYGHHGRRPLIPHPAATAPVIPTR
jgi:hypothetical protein